MRQKYESEQGSQQIHSELSIKMANSERPPRYYKGGGSNVVCKKKKLKEIFLQIHSGICRILATIIPSGEDV
jgi:hypothetical protein